MKTLKLLSAVLAIAASSCTKQVIKRTTTPAPLNFEIIGKDGKSLVTSKKDTITISYIESGVTKWFQLSIEKLQISDIDTTTVPKYNGLYITDNAFVSDLSSQPSPVRTFNLNLNGTYLGVIYLDYWGYQDAYPQASSAALTFNNIPVRYDNSIPLTGSPINLLQMQ